MLEATPLLLVYPVEKMRLVSVVTSRDPFIQSKWVNWMENAYVVNEPVTILFQQFDRKRRMKRRSMNVQKATFNVGRLKTCQTVKSWMSILITSCVSNQKERHQDRNRMTVLLLTWNLCLLLTESLLQITKIKTKTVQTIQMLQTVQNNSKRSKQPNGVSTKTLTLLNMTCLEISSFPTMKKSATHLSRYRR